MAFIHNPRAADFQFGILIQDAQILLAKSGRLLTGAELGDITGRYNSNHICCRYGETAYRTCTAVLTKQAAEPQDLSKYSIRELFASAPEETAQLVARALHISEWLMRTRFCITCGHQLQFSSTESALECPQCCAVIFPVIAPCIIVLVSKGEQILLARHAQRNTDLYTCLAGFIEAGETAEQAVIREVKEETGLNVKNIRYCGSQSWPYPNQLMLAFKADYESGTITVQKEEIAEAYWFSKNALPAIPRAGSAAHRLICGEW